jgi:hypothetical protein
VVNENERTSANETTTTPPPPPPATHPPMTDEAARHAAGNASSVSAAAAMAPDGGGGGAFHVRRCTETGWVVYIGDPDNEISGVPAFPTPTDPRVGMTKPALINWLLHGKNIRHLTNGGMNACALSQGGQVSTWGSPDNGALGRPSSMGRSAEPLPVEQEKGELELELDHVESGGTFSVGLTKDGKVCMWGRYRTHGDDVGIVLDPNGKARFGCFYNWPTRMHGFKDERVVDLYASSSANYFYAVTASGELYSCGTYCTCTGTARTEQSRDAACSYGFALPLTLSFPCTFGIGQAPRLRGSSVVSSQIPPPTKNSSLFR